MFLLLLQVCDWLLCDEIKPDRQKKGGGQLENRGGTNILYKSNLCPARHASYNSNLTAATIHYSSCSLPSSFFPSLFSSFSISFFCTLYLFLSLSSSYARPLTSFLSPFDQRSSISAGVFKEREGSPALFSLSYPSVLHLSVLSFAPLPYFLLTLIFLFYFFFTHFLIFFSQDFFRNVGFNTVTMMHVYVSVYVCVCLLVCEQRGYCSSVQLHSRRVASESLKLIWPEGAAPETCIMCVCVCLFL